jgi:hypothetical protein
MPRLTAYQAERPAGRNPAKVFLTFLKVYRSGTQNNYCALPPLCQEEGARMGHRVALPLIHQGLKLKSSKRFFGTTKAMP